MQDTRTFLDMVVDSLRRAAAFNQLDAVPPAAVIWPDKVRAWEPLIPLVRKRLPVVSLGPYDPERQTGPAVWLRCAVAGLVADAVPAHGVPVVYLPGIGATELQEPGLRTRELAMLIDLRYRGALWVGADGHDRQVAEFFRNQADGLGVAVREDDYTRRAMLRVLPALADITVASLQENAPWRARDFESLVEESVTSLIKLGESSDLEFKSSARWDMQEQRQNAVLEQVIVKTVAGFLNSQRGGTLLIGVVDNGSICGLTPDFNCWRKNPDKQNADHYQLWLIELLLKGYGREFAPFIGVTFHPLATAEGEKIVCKVQVSPASRPVFITEDRCKGGGEKDEVFYLRTGNATNRLTTRAAVEYIRSRWD